VQQAQLDLVTKGYLPPAIATAKQLGFSSELGLALSSTCRYRIVA
jgi:hypothetical protein